MFAFKKSFKHLYSFSIRHMSNDSKILFHIKKEIDKFTKVFKDFPPQLHIITGPPSSGKTALIREVVNNNGFRPKINDCRSGFDSPRNIFNSIYRQFNSLTSRYYSSHLEQLRKNDNEPVKVDDVKILFNEISEFLLSWTYWKNEENENLPIFVIDEADMLRQLSDKSIEGKNLLKIFLNWLVKITKQDKNLQVVLISSDPFFPDFIENSKFYLRVIFFFLDFILIHNLFPTVLGHPHFISYIIGDLSKEDAMEFFENQVLPQYGMHLLYLLSIYFS
jgi:AAA+ ATPase superfamily predicted ATPase